MRVLHICPDSMGDPRQFYLGSTKDALGRTEYLEARGIPYDQLLVRWRSDELLLADLSRRDLNQFSAAIFELPLYPRSMAYLRAQASQVRIILRPINAEFYHQLHVMLARGWRLRGRGTPGTLRSNMRTLQNGFRRLRLDVRCARLADVVLCITAWELSHYWAYVTDRAKLRYMPYYQPERYPRPLLGHDPKPAQCTCLTSTIFNPLLLDAVRNYGRLVSQLGADDAGWQFLLVGDPPTPSIALPARVVITGLLASPLDALTGSRALAQLSDYGFGFKTKLLDAVQCRCFLLVTHRLFRRLPPEIQPFCLVVDVNSIASFRRALNQCDQPYPAGDPNQAFRAQAFTALDQALLT